jgi:WD40 repeat protein/DNA-binding SARP family transcriptional activator
VDYRVLGALEVQGDDGPVALGGTKQRAVLAHLVLRAGTLVPADRLIDELWGDDPPPAARNVLQTYVSRLRKAFGRGRLESRSGGYVLHAEPQEIDARRFESLIAGARLTAATDPAAAAASYREAETLWRGPALDDLAGQDSLRAEIGHLEELRIRTIEERVVVELAAGRHGELVAELETLTAQHPLREALWGNLMTALYRSGRQADALAAYRRARSLLVGELGIEPSAELRRLEAQVLRQDPALDVAGRPVRGFRLLERVGEGSFGVVHRALQPQVGREVAIKVIRPALADDPEFIRRFEAEAQLVARLEHPRIVPLYDYWREPGGAFLVMRFLRGGSLREALADGPLPVERALTVVEHVGAGLAAAHRQHVVHRDVKPANVLLDDEGNAYLSDFGIARDVERAATTARADTDGSAYYLAPEEARGLTPTPRADVYSLGVVLFEMLTGSHPLAGLAPHELAGARVPRLGPDVPSGLAEVVARATAADPAERHPDASALLAALATAERTVAATHGPIRNPYKGLRPFLEADAPDFDGRADLVARVLERIAGTRLLALAGPSGSGKSSVVHAGVVPALRADGMFVATMHPGTDPFAELAGALDALAPARTPPRLDLTGAPAWLLPDSDAELLLVVDQFEELFTLAGDDARTAFLSELTAAATDPAGRVRILVTLRADVLDGPLVHSGFAEVLRAGTELVVPLTPEELEQAISGPAARAGADVEPGLVAQLVADVLGQPGALPMLQFTLAELFDRGAGGSLTLAAYRELGGVAGAIARGAEAVYASLGAPGRAVAQQLFLRLVDPAGVRRRVPRAELLGVVGDAQAMAAAIDAFAGRRLLAFDRDPDTREPTVEIAHDALLRAWARLHAWVQEAEDDLRARRRLATAAADWVDAGRDPSFLLRGARLERLEAWRDDTAMALAPGERSFLDASLAERTRLRAEAEAQELRERALEHRSVRRLRALVGVLAGAALLAGALMTFAFDQRSEADDQRRTAEARGLAAAAAAALEEDAERGVLLGLEAIARTRTSGGAVLPEAAEALHRAVTASRIALRVPGLGGALDWSPDGELFVTEGPEDSGRIDVRDAVTGRSVRTFAGHDPDVNLVAFSADGARLATSGDDGRVKVWNPRTGALLHTFGSGRDQVWGVSFSPDGTRLAAAWWGAGVVRIFDTERGRRVAEVGGLMPSFATSFSPDGRRLAIATFDAAAVVVDASSGRRLAALAGQDGVSDVDWSPDGRWIATSGFDATVRIWRARTGRTRFTLTGHQADVVAADWSADSRLLATGSRDGTARVWSVGRDEARELVSLAAQERGGGLWVAFSPDGERLMTGDEGITAVKVWDIGRSGTAEWANVGVARGEFAGVAFAPDGSAVVTGDSDGSVGVWQVRAGNRASILHGLRAAPLALDVSHVGLVAAADGETVRAWDLARGAERFALAMPGAVDVDWSHDGAQLAIAAGNGEVHVVSREGVRITAVGGDPQRRITAVSFSPDGRLLAVAGTSSDRRAGPANATVVWDWRRNVTVQTLPSPAFAVDFSPDGALIATAPPNGPAAIWDARTGRPVARLAGHTGGIFQVAFAPNGSQVATASADATVRLWDPRTGRQELVLRGHDGTVFDLAFSPDGSRLVTAGPEGVARVWALALDDLVTIARQQVTRRLTAGECRQYLRDRGCSDG